MKKLVIILLALPIQSWAMQSNTNVMLTRSAVNNVIEIDSDSEASLEEVTTHQPVRMSNVIENTITPRGARINDSIRLLNARIAQLKGSISHNVMQPFTTWFGAINYVNQHAKSNKFTCPSCNKIFTSVGIAAGCFLKHFNQNIFACEKCNSYNDTLDLYYSHKKTCNPIPISVPSTPLPTYSFDNGASRAKKLVDQKVAKIDCCGLSLSNWARGLNHVALAHAHKRAQTLFTCSKCNKLFDSAQNALACVVKHDDASIFTCPNCMVDCVLHDAFLKHVCPLIKTEIKSEPITNLAHNDPYNETVATNSPQSSSSMPDAHQYYSSPMPLTPLTAMLYGNVNTPDSGYISSPLSNQSSVVSDGADTQEPIAEGNQDTSLVFDPTKSVEDNVKILRNIIKKRISDNRYNCCEHYGIGWEFFCEHVRKAHSVEYNKVQCPQCNKILSSYNYGYHHIATHTHKSLFSCPLACANRKSPHQRLADQRENGDNLIVHFKSCFKKKYNLQFTNQFVCPFCRKNQFSNKSNFKRHVDSCKTKTQQGNDQDFVHDYDPVTPEFGTINTPEYAFALDNESVMDANFQRVTNPVYDYLGVHESSPDFFNYYSSPDVDMPSDQFNHFPIPSQTYEDNNTNVISNTVVIDSNNTNQQTTTHHVTDAAKNSSTKKDAGKELKIISYTYVQKRKRTRRGNISEPAKQPVVYEGHTFDAQGLWDYNLGVFNNLIAARITAKSFACCELKNLTWQEFCTHQKEKHKKLIDGANKVVCTVCDKSNRTAAFVHEHSAAHQYPGLFKCPVCAYENKLLSFDNKENLLKHFRKCFADKYPSANNDSAELHSENNTPEQEKSISINEQHNAGFEPVTDQQYYSPTQTHIQTISNPLFNYGDQTNYYELDDLLSDSEYNRSPQLFGATGMAIEHGLLNNHAMHHHAVSNDIANICAEQPTHQHASQIICRPQNSKKRKAQEITITQFQGKKKKLRGGVEKLNIAHPMVIEGHTFDKEGDWNHNLAVLHKLLAARHAAHTYSCCELKGLSWNNFCAHQKEKHRKLINGSHLAACNDCGKSFKLEAWTHDHSATHQYPKLFSCPVCIQNNSETTHDHKQLLIKHFKTCFYKNYVAEQPMSDEVSSEEDSDGDYVNYGK
jgi:hypothetical protein